MTPDEILAFVRHTFRRAVWREINQRQFIADHWGPYCWGYDTRDRVDRSMVPDDLPPVFHDVSHVHTPADRVGFYAYEQPGMCVADVRALTRVEFR